MTLGWMFTSMLWVLIVVALVAILGSQASAASGSAVQSNDTGVQVTQSDQSLTGAAITNDPGTWPGASSQFPNQACWNICAAVAFAEGYNLGAGTVPYDLNNPGDISDGAKQYAAQSHSGSQVTVFPTAEIGWEWLYNKWANILAGSSAVYSGKTWAQVAGIWAGNSAAWLKNVTDYLGVDPNDLPASYVATS